MLMTEEEMDWQLELLADREDINDELLANQDCLLDTRYKQGYNKALEDFAKLFIAKSQEKRYLRHIWIRQTCEAAIRKLKKEDK